MLLKRGYIMTSINKTLIKTLCILLLFILGISFSAFSTLKQSQITQNINQQLSNTQTHATIASTQKSAMGKKLQHDLSMLTPGNTHFNTKFLHYALTTKNKQEVK